ncbi:DNA primase [Methylicorpusculum oleiharenae]|nr:DNA primase [Methylicorpusculum oleiharenae]MCD2449792.1 DNA primase [Methylicorpusculum oleiharenae]
MSGRIPSSFINDLLARVDIVDLIDSRVPLKKTGSNYVARCPFHTEKTPSFSVSAKKQFFHCFGCGASGNAITFLMDYNHLDFVEAVEDLAAFAGIEVQREKDVGIEQPEKKDISHLYNLMGSVAAFYAEQLKQNPEAKKAVEYLKVRGVSGEIAKSFMLGYAPGDWNSLSGRYDTKDLLETGMLVARDGGGSYDRFRGRIMFPIRNKRGNVVGFGARVLDDTLPKYLNSPETSLFSKSNEVYGLYELLNAKQKPERILIVEGYMDVVALAQFGINYAVAALGTAISKAHVDLLFRFSKEIVFCLDGDSAGRQAAWRAMESVFSSVKDGRIVKMMLLPHQHDPDSLVREEGVDKFEQRMAGAATLSDYFFGQLTADLGLGTVEGRAQLVEKAKRYLELLPYGVFREMMFAKLETMSGMGSLDVLSKKAKLNFGRPRKGTGQVMRTSPARVALALLVQNPELADLLEQEDMDWSHLDFPGCEIFREIMSVILRQNPPNASVLLEQLRGHPDEKLVNKLATMELLVPEDGVKAEFLGAIKAIVSGSRTIRIEKLIDKEQSEGLDESERTLLKKLLSSSN